MRYKVIDYGNLDLNELIMSVDMRRNIYLESLNETNLHIDNIKTKDID